MVPDSLTIVLDARVHLPLPQLDAVTVEQIKALFTHKNPKHFKLKRLGYAATNEPANIKTWKIEGGSLSVPRGGFKSLRELLRARGYDFRVLDNRCKGDSRFAGLPDYNGHRLRDYQVSAVASMLATQNTILRAATGSGKTSSLIAFAATVKLPTLVIVWMSSLYEQWIRRISEELRIPPHEIGEIRGGVKRFAPITVAMQQSLWNRLTPDVLNFPGTLIVDECHRAAARTLQEVADAFPAYYRVGASDDERRKDEKEFLIYDVFGQPSQDIKYNDLADAGHILDVDVICIPTDYEPPVEYWDSPDFNVLLNDMTNDAARNQLINKIIAAVASSGEQLFVMSHRVNHCVDLVNHARRSGLRAGLLVGAPEYKQEFRETLTQMETGFVQVGVGTYQSIGTGLDMAKIGVAIATTPIAGNETTFRQGRGRICRTAKGKESATMYYMLDKMYGKKHVKNLCKWSRRVFVMLDQRLVPAAEWLERQ